MSAVERVATGDAPVARPRWRVWGARALRAALALALFAVAWLALSSTGHYFVRAAWEEGKILANRRDIATLVADPSVDGDTRQRLRLVLAARRFAADSVDLDVRDSFTTYSRLQHDTLVLVLSAAYRDRLEAYSWWFPIVGRVPYKGFFDFGTARDAARGLSSRGLDVYLRPSSAFSTLGFFNDPLLSTTLREDTLDLANTVIHEVTHNTFYARGQAVFNESFANFVGARGAEWFFRSRGERSAAERTALRWDDDKLMGAFWTRLHATLDSAYAAHPTDSLARLAARDTVELRARRLLIDSIAPRLRTIPRERVARLRLDNAALLARRIYLTDLDLFDLVHARLGGDLRATIDTVIAAAERDGDRPFDALRRWLATPR